MNSGSFAHTEALDNIDWALDAVEFGEIIKSLFRSMVPEGVEMPMSPLCLIFYSFLPVFAFA